MKRRFVVELSTEVELEIDDAVIKTGTSAEWAAQFFKLTETGLAEHLAFNFVINHLNLDEVDGFCDQPRDAARLLVGPEWEIDATRLT